MTMSATEDFLVHLQQRLALNEEAATSTLARWLWTYEPGPIARAHQGGSTTHTPDELVAQPLHATA